MITRSMVLSAAALSLSISAIAGSALALPAPSVGAVAPVVSQARSAITPGLVGNTIQGGVSTVRIGATNGLIGRQGTPTTLVGVSALTPTNQPEGSVATVGVANNPNSLLSVNASPR